jgi:hypothetical protein
MTTVTTTSSIDDQLAEVFGLTREELAERLGTKKQKVIRASVHLAVREHAEHIRNLSKRDPGSYTARELMDWIAKEQASVQKWRETRARNLAARSKAST